MGNWWHKESGGSIGNDLDHLPPIPPHLDFQLRQPTPEYPNKNGYRWYPDGTMEPKQVPPKDFNAENIHTTIRMSAASHVVGFFLKCGITTAIQKQDVPDATYKNILDNIVEIYVSTYDREGHVIWTK